jgi:hypothetical protein
MDQVTSHLFMPLPYPWRVKFLRQRTADADEPTDEEVVEDTSTTVGTKGYTPSKGRPTPKRREAEGRKRGPVAPPPRTQREAAKRSRGTKDDRRRATAERRERMAAGDERYLLARDKGPVKAYVRNLVDSRRHLIGLFMPLALLVVVAMLSPSSYVQVYAAPVLFAVLLVFAVEGFFVGRSVVKAVRVKFPDAPDRALGLGWYAFVRASQIRKLRVPKPQVKPGDEVR